MLLAALIDKEDWSCPPWRQKLIQSGNLSKCNWVLHSNFKLQGHCGYSHRDCRLLPKRNLSGLTSGSNRG